MPPHIKTYDHVKLKAVNDKHEQLLASHLNAVNIPYEQEYRFAAIATGGIGKGSRARIQDQGFKDWRFDFAMPELLIAIEIEGGNIFANESRHTSVTGFADDCVKYNSATMLGWSVLRFTPKMVKSGEALLMIEKTIRARSGFRR